MVPAPSPMHSNLDYVYTIDQDAGAFKVSLWREFVGLSKPTAICLDLARIPEDQGLFPSHLLQRPKYSFEDKTDEANETRFTPLATGMLDMGLSMSILTNEPQEPFFTDFVFIWRF
jgi:hypothetical protein